MTLARRFHRAGLAVVVLSIACYGVSSGHWAVAVLAVGAAALGWMLTRGGEVRVAPSWLMVGLVWIAVAYGVFNAIADDLDVAAFCEFLISVIAVKMWDRKQPRDWAQVLTLSAFLVIGAVLTSTSLGMGLLLVACVVTQVYAAMLLQMYGASHRARAALGPVSAAAVSGVPLVGAGHGRGGPAWTREMGASLRRSTAAAVVLGLVVSVVVFMVMPRGIGRGDFGRWLQSRGSSVTGYTDRVHLGRSGPIYTSQENVLDLAVKDAGGRNLGGEGKIYYLRGATLDTYLGDGEWTRARAGSEDMLFAGQKKVLNFGQTGGGPVVQEVLVRNAPSRVALWTLWRPMELELEARGEVTLDSRDLSLIRERGAPGPMRYKVRSDFVTLPTYPPPGGRVEGVSFPVPEVLAITESLLRTAGLEPDPAVRAFEEDAAVARAVESSFRNGFRYTLDQSVPPRDVDPIVHFLTSSREGHCEYFASAMTAMLRSVGVNARLVTGYVAAEYNAASGHYVVRESNAHAWVEVQEHTGQWRQYDPTPPADLRLLHERPRTLASNFWSFLDAIEYAWIDSFVGFDENARLDLLGARAERATVMGRAARWMSQRTTRGGGRLLADAALNGLAAFGVTAGVLLAGRWVWLRRARAAGRRSWAGEAAKDAAAARLLADAEFYERTLELWRRAGVPKPEHAPPLAHAGRIVAGLTPAAGAASRRLAELFYAVRFGRRELSEAERAEVRAGLELLSATRR